MCFFKRFIEPGEIQYIVLTVGIYGDDAIYRVIFQSPCIAVEQCEAFALILFDMDDLGDR